MAAFGAKLKKFADGIESGGAALLKLATHYKVLSSLVVGTLLVLLLCFLPLLQVPHRGLDTKEWLSQVNEARKTLAQILGGAFLLFGLYLSLESFILSREGQITDRFSKAIEQLGTPGDDKLEVRLGGIFALERIARDSERDHSVIVEVLIAYVQEHAARSDRKRAVPQASTEQSEKRALLCADIQSILTVLGRREVKYDRPRLGFLDLSYFDLNCVNLHNAHFEDAHFMWSDLTHAFLMNIHFERADLTGADLEGAWFTRAHLKGADLSGANLAGANNLTQEQVDSATGDVATKLPPGLRMPDSWA
jgi:Pentapeptide repeats (8 copies)